MFSLVCYIASNTWRAPYEFLVARSLLQNSVDIQILTELYTDIFYSFDFDYRHEFTHLFPIYEKY